MVLILISIAAFILLYFFSNRFKPTANLDSKSYVQYGAGRNAIEAKVNSIIRDIRCESCCTDEVPIYSIDGDGYEKINCCCAEFAQKLQDEINGHHDTKKNPKANIYVMPHGDMCVPKKVKPTSLPNIYNEKSSLPCVSPIVPKIFSQADTLSLDDEPIHQAIRVYDHTVVAYHVGTLENGRKYALIVGTSDEWVNVIAYNWAKSPVYQQYGFSISEMRWSYGSKVLGAPQVREVIKDHITEIKEIMATQEHVRKAKAEERLRREIEEERREQEERALFDNIQASRRQTINLHFVGLEFEVIASKLNDASVLNDIQNTYYSVDLISQKCTCEDYVNQNSNYQANDIRRLCKHLRKIISGNRLFKQNNDRVKNFIQENAWGNLSGIYYSELQNHMPFAVIAYTWTLDVFVVTPSATGLDFNMVKWRNENGAWFTSKANKTFRDEIAIRLTELFTN